MAIGTSQRPIPLRWGRRGRELTRRRYLTGQPTGELPRPARPIAEARSRAAMPPRGICVRVAQATQGAVVSEVTLEDRGRALEDQFFEKENQAKLVAMKHK